MTDPKEPFFIRLRPHIMSALRAVAATENCTITSIIEDALDKELPIRTGSELNVIDLSWYFSGGSDGMD